jgi:hypothetical protein
VDLESRSPIGRPNPEDDGTDTIEATDHACAASVAFELSAPWGSTAQAIDVMTATPAAHVPGATTRRPANRAAAAWRSS